MSHVQDRDYGKLFETMKEYALKKHSCNIEHILKAEDISQHYSIHVSAMSLLGFCIEFAHCLFNKPDSALKLLADAFCAAMKIVYKQLESTGKIMSMKKFIHARLVALPSCPEIHRTVMPQCNDIGQFLCITGTLLRVTATKLLEYRKEWQCNKCKYKFTLDLEMEQDYAITKPTVCRSHEWCNSKNFTLLSDGLHPEWCRDYQEVKIQEQMHNLVIGTVPRSMWVILMDDLVDSCQPGNEVIISGVLHTRWQPLSKGARSNVELVLLAHNVEVKSNSHIRDVFSDSSLREFTEFWTAHQENPLVGRDFILSSLCPQIFGLYVVKLAVALVLAGGVQRIDKNGKIRGDTHLLLVGDPGTGKSQFLKYAAKISRRSVLTSGVGTTTAGLTAAAVKDGNKWQLEAGALVLADGGICCIDEFSSIKEADKASIHEAMEQQTISVAKAGLVCKLSTQCSILAATNPKGKYNKNESLSVNTAMASPLLSRFDIILVLLDTYCEEWDKLVSSYILEGKDLLIEYKGYAAWPISKMKSYFSVIRNIQPKLSRECDSILQAYYKEQRKTSDRNAARTTPRLLQSLMRLAQGHARLMFRDSVIAADAIVAITIMESSMVGCGLFSDGDALHTTFPEDPQSSYLQQAEAVLKILNLEDLLKNGAHLFPTGQAKISDVASYICKMTSDQPSCVDKVATRLSDQCDKNLENVQSSSKYFSNTEKNLMNVRSKRQSDTFLNHPLSKKHHIEDASTFSDDSTIDEDLACNRQQRTETLLNQTRRPRLGNRSKSLVGDRQHLSNNFSTISELNDLFQMEGHDETYENPHRLENFKGGSWKQ